MFRGQEPVHLYRVALTLYQRECKRSEGQAVFEPVLRCFCFMEVMKETPWRTIMVTSSLNEIPSGLRSAVKKVDWW